MSNYILFGGSFNPLHIGHVNVIENLLQAYPEDQMILLPSYKSPLKEYDYDPGVEHRYNFLTSFFEHNKQIKVDDLELKKGERVFTIDALPALFEKYNIENLKLVVGTDQLLQFHKWKAYKGILEKVDLVVVSRPGFDFAGVEDLNENLLELVEDYQDSTLKLKSGRNIYIHELSHNIDISSSYIRSHLRKGADMSEHLPEGSLEFFEKHELYKPIKFKVESYEDFTKDCFHILKEKNALGVLAYDVRSITQPSEFNLIASGTNIRQTSAIAENLIKTVKKKYALSPLTVEGLSEGRWVVIDYGSLIVHVFYDFIRSEYNLEELWSKGVLLESDE